MPREKELILKASPCDTNFYDRTLLTLQQRLDRGTELCPNYPACETGNIRCTLTCGWEVAQYVVKGSNLKKEMKDFSYVSFINEKFWRSVNRRDFEIITGKPDVLSAVEHAARIILLKDAFDSSLERCSKCNGVKLEEIVYDSVHLKLLPCAGTGETKARTVLYCQKCEQKPVGGIIYEEDLGDDFFRRLNKK